MSRWYRVFVVSVCGLSCSPKGPATVLPCANSLSSSAPALPAPTPIDPSGEWELRWDRSFAKWNPAVLEATLSIQRDGSTWTSSIAFRESEPPLVFESIEIEGEHIHLVFRSGIDSADTSTMELSGWIREDRIVGEIRWGDIKWTPVGGRRAIVPPLHRTPVEHGLPAVALTANDIDLSLLETIVGRATNQRSSALVLAKDGKLGVEMYAEGYSGSPISAMSASKSVVSLAVGMLIAEGKLKLDTTMGSLFSEWKKMGAKGSITVNQLLNHTSGLHPSRASWATESIREHAANAKLNFAPGTRFQYNNAAVDFLGVVFKQAAGMSMDAYLDKHLFRKLDMVGVYFMKDKEGVPRGGGELMIRPVDLAKIGQLMLDDGMWQGERIVPAEWIEQSVKAGQPFRENIGLLWWREGSFSRTLTEVVLDAWEDIGIESTALDAVRPLLGEKFTHYKDYRAAIEKALGPAAFTKIDDIQQQNDHFPFSTIISDGPVWGFSARGWLGQWLVVLPKARIVAVRMRQSDPSDYGTPSAKRIERNGYGEFPDDVVKLVPPSR